MPGQRSSRLGHDLPLPAGDRPKLAVQGQDGGRVVEQPQVAADDPKVVEPEDGVVKVEALYLHPVEVCVCVGGLRQGRRALALTEWPS